MIPTQFKTRGGSTSLAIAAEQLEDGVRSWNVCHGLNWAAWRLQRCWVGVPLLGREEEASLAVSRAQARHAGAGAAGRACTAGDEAATACRCARQYVSMDGPEQARARFRVSLAVAAPKLSASREARQARSSQTAEAQPTHSSGTAAEDAVQDAAGGPHLSLLTQASAFHRLLQASCRNVGVLAGSGRKGVVGFEGRYRALKAGTGL